MILNDITPQWQSTDYVRQLLTDNGLVEKYDLLVASTLLTVIVKYGATLWLPKDGRGM